MCKMRSCLFIFVILVLGLSPALPAQDLPTTAYDESETQPYELNLPNPDLIARAVSPIRTALSEAEGVQSALYLQTSIYFTHRAKPTTRTDAPRFTGARSLLAQVCTLLF